MFPHGGDTVLDMLAEVEAYERHSKARGVAPTPRLNGDR